MEWHVCVLCVCVGFLFGFVFLINFVWGRGFHDLYIKSMHRNIPIKDHLQCNNTKHKFTKCVLMVSLNKTYS